MSHTKAVIVQITFLTLSLFLSFFAHAQSKKDSIEIIRKPNGAVFYQQNGNALKPALIQKQLIGNDEAYTKFQSARIKSGIGVCLGAVGGYCVGYPLGRLVVGYKDNLGMIGVGLCLSVVAVSLEVGAKKQSIKAVKLYNQGIRSVGYIQPQRSPKLHFLANTSGIGISATF